MPNPNSPRGKHGAGAGIGSNRGSKSSSKRSKRQQPGKANSKLADEPNNETNLEDYHFSEFFPHEELQTQRAAARRRSSDSISASAAIVAAAAAEAGNLSNSSNMVLDPDLVGADASAAPFHDYNSQGSLDLMDRLNMDLSFDAKSPQFDTVKRGGRKGDRSSSITHLHKQSGGLTASRRELHLSDSDTFASVNVSGTPGGTSSSSHRDDDGTKHKHPPPPPASQAIASADTRRITRRGRRRSTSNPDLHLGDSKNSSGTFEVADSTDDDASTRNKKGQEKGEGKKRRVSDYSLASMMLLMPNMDDFSAKGEKDQEQQHQKQESSNVGTELKQQRPRGRDRRSRKAWGSADDLPDSKPSDINEGKANKSSPTSSPQTAVGSTLDIGMNDVTDRWNQVARSSEQQWTEQSFRYKKSRSLSPYSRGLVGNLPPGNLEPNSSGRISIRSELSDNDTSTLRSSDETGRESDNKKEGGRAKKKKPKDTKITRPDQAGLQGLWLVLPKRLRKRQSGEVKENKSNDNDDDASLSPSEAHRFSAADLERGSIGPGGLARSKSKREIRREQAELNASKATLTGQGKLGDQMVMGREIKRRKIILRCCLVLIGLVVVLVIPLLFSVPGFQGLLPPRLAEVVDDLMHRLQASISYVSENFRGPGQQFDDLGRPLDPSTGLPIGMEIEEPIDNVRSRVPFALRNMINVGDVVDEGRGLTQTPASPLIWDLDYSGSKALERVFADCLGMRVAGDLGNDENNQLYARESQLRLVDVSGLSYVNVDLRTTFGIDRARDLLLIPSGQSDVAVSPQVFYASRKLFNASQKGQLLCLLRDPIERELANYQHLVQTNSYLLQGITSLKQYADEFGMTENYMTRILAGHEHGINPATPKMLEIAKDVLRAKCLVGLHEQLPASINRVVKYIDLESVVDTPPSSRPCMDDVAKREMDTVYDLPKVKEGDSVYEALARRNSLDLELYHYALGIFSEQGYTLFSGGIESSDESKRLMHLDNKIFVGP